jgi:hypothetical protein
MHTREASAVARWCRARSEPVACLDVGGFPNRQRHDRKADLADYIDRVLKGANPAVLPIENPIRTALVVNRKTADLLGLTLPLPS